MTRKKVGVEEDGPVRREHSTIRGNADASASRDVYSIAAKRHDRRSVVESG
jgi:hypothetical protein